MIQGKALPERVARFVIGHRWLVLGMLAAVSTLFACLLPRLTVEISPEGMRLVGHPDTVYYEQYTSKFGSDEIIVIELNTTDVFSTEALACAKRLTERLQGLANVRRVVSLSNVDDIRADRDGIVIEPLMADLPGSREEAERLRERVHGNPLVYGNLVSRDDRSTLVVVEVERSGDDFPRRRRLLVERIFRLVRQEETPERRLYVAGFPVLVTVLPELLVEDQKRFMPVILVLLLATLWVAFRSFWGVFLPVCTVGLSLVWALGFIVLCGKKVEIVTNVLPPLVMVIGIADAVHILAHYQEVLETCARGKVRALQEATSYILVPCLLTSLTTAIGFGSLTISRVAGIRDLGILAAFGVMAAFVISVTLVPAVLSLLPEGAMRRRDAGTGKGGRVESALGNLAGFNEQRGMVVICLTLVLVALSMGGMFRLKVETTLINYLKEGNPLVKAVRHIEKHITGTSTLDVVFDFGGPEAAKDPANLAKLVRMEAYLEGVPEITHCLSLADIIARMDQVFHHGSTPGRLLPWTREEVAQYLLLYSMSGDEDELSRYVDDEYRTAVVRARLKTVSSAEMDRIIEDVKGFIQASFPGDSVRVTGISVLVADSIDAIVRGQVQSLGLALAVIFILMSLLFFSIKMGVVSMIPNVIPILVTLGLMGWLDIPINTATATISCVAIGIAVDDTIHYLSRFKIEQGKGAGLRAAARVSLTTAGRAMCFTSAILTAGFLVLILSNFKPILYFGFLTAVTMASALLGDLVLLPVLLVVLHRFWQSPCSRPAPYRHPPGLQP